MTTTEATAPAEDLRDPNWLAGIIVRVVRLAGIPVDPNLLIPVARLLSEAGHLDTEGVTFGCNYDLDVLSHELSRGFVRAMDSGLIQLYQRRITVSSQAMTPARELDPAAQKMAAELFALELAELHARARKLLIL